MKLRDAITQVLEEHGDSLTIADIKERVGDIRTDPTSQSVGYILTTGSTADKGKFTRVEKGVYRLRAEGEAPSEKKARETAAA